MTATLGRNRIAVRTPTDDRKFHLKWFIQHHKRSHECPARRCCAPLTRPCRVIAAYLSWNRLPIISSAPHPMPSNDLAKIRRNKRKLDCSSMIYFFPARFLTFGQPICVFRAGLGGSLDSLHPVQHARRAHTARIHHRRLNDSVFRQTTSKNIHILVRLLFFVLFLALLHIRKYERTLCSRESVKSLTRDKRKCLHTISSHTQ